MQSSALERESDVSQRDGKVCSAKEFAMADTAVLTNYYHFNKMAA